MPRARQEDSCCSRSTQTQTPLSTLVCRKHTCTPKRPLFDWWANVKRISRGREGPRKGRRKKKTRRARNLLGEAVKKPVLNYRSSLPPMHKPMMYIAVLRNAWNTGGAFRIDDVKITQNILSLDHANSHRMMLDDTVLQNHIAGWELKDSSLLHSWLGNNRKYWVAPAQDEMRLYSAKWRTREMFSHSMQPACIMHSRLTHRCLPWKYGVK